jgi:Nif-specific regulatory protein
MEKVSRIARVPRPILIQGESGSGKEVIAKQIHLASCKYNGVKSTQPFISINCPAVPESLLESELFGYEKGSFTGAAKDFKGKIRLSDGGTLFLDEIGDLSLNVQPKLLRFLENKKIIPLGGNKEFSVNTRVICATNKDLKEMVRKGLFREDLFYRINTFIIKVPPLRERKNDIMPLADYFLTNLSRELGEQKKHLPDSILTLFKKYEWPGNVRELRNIIERAVLLSTSENITDDDIPAEFQKQSFSENYPVENKIEHSEKNMLLSTLIKTGWNITASAKTLGLTRGAMRYKIDKYKLKQD